MAIEPEMIADYACVTGEGPLWHPGERKLYWVDIPQGRMFRYDPANNEHAILFEEGVIGGFTIQSNGDLLLFMARGAVKTYREGKFTTIIEDITVERESRFNDVIADPEGRVFCGTMSTDTGLGRLYRLDTNGEITVVLEEIGCPNGMGFTPDLKRMYFTDSDKREIYLFDYDRATGELTNQRVWVNSPAELGVPDGMTVDQQGNVWSANWDGSCLVQYSPDGAEIQRIQFPAKKVSSVTFAGDDFTDMYVTTAGGDNKAEEGAGAGALFRLRLGVKGVPEFQSRIYL